MRRKRWIVAVVAAAILAAGGAFWLAFLGPTVAQARIATGYLAKTVCSCVFVGGETLDRCKSDALLDRSPQMARIEVTLEAGRKQVRAHFFPFPSDTAIFEEGFGCRLK